VRTADFDYTLPQELIAQTPLEPRDASRLLVVNRSSGELTHRYFHEILQYLRSEDLLICNDSRVIPARLYGHKVPTGGKVELLLLSKRGDRVWEALTRGKRIRPNTVIALHAPEGVDTTPPAGRVVEVTTAGSRLIEFESPIEGWLDEIGIVPLPPYIHEPLSEAERYQTVYAQIKGSVAAPTAGLHFTPPLMEQAQSMGVEFAFVTLHIGMDTFRPVQEEEIEEHHIHTEVCELRPAVADKINQAHREGRRIIAVGTTSVRVLESAGRPAHERGLADAVLPMVGPTDLFIYPGYEFRVVDQMITNFHLPRSTLLMLVSAFAGRDLILRAYEEAISEQYRFYSFGDAMLLM